MSSPYGGPTIYGSGALYGTGLQPGVDFKRGHIIVPENRVRVNGTIRTRYGYPFGFEDGTGVDLGVLTDIKISYQFRPVSVDAESLADSRLIEVASEEFEIELELLEYDFNVIRSVVPGLFNHLEYDEKFFMSFGGYREFDEDDFNSILIEFYNCSYGNVASLSDIVRGGYLHMYKGILTNGLDILNAGPKKPMSLTLKFTGVRDLTRNVKDQIGCLALY